MAQSKSKKRSAYLKLIPSALCIAVTLFAGLAASMAWFSMNDKVSANGMKISLNTNTPSLVIAKTDSALLDAGVSDTTVTYTDTEQRSYVPVTHIGSGDSENDFPYLLKYAKSGAGVDKNTGLDENLEFNAVESYANEDNEYYFAEFEVYIGSLHSTLTDVDLIADFWDRNVLPASMTDRQKAASIDFYVKNANDEFEYVTTTNLAGGQSVTLKEGTSIPLSTSGNSICVLMRFYFDGALTYEKGNITVAYIRTAEAVDSNVNLGITFRAEKHNNS